MTTDKKEPVTVSETHELLTAHEAAAKLRVSVETIRRYVKAGKLRGFKLGKKTMRVVAADIAELIGAGAGV
jgi:excisionase family DNA binding protein